MREIERQREREREREGERETYRVNTKIKSEIKSVKKFKTFSSYGRDLTESWRYFSFSEISKRNDFTYYVIRDYFLCPSVHFPDFPQLGTSVIKRPVRTAASGN